MSGKPAARMGDMTKYGGPIVQGSLGVMIGAPTGVACSVCPGGRTSGNPVNPLLGAKVQPGETDIALPGPLPFIFSRSYSSYQTRTPAPVGILGPGWKAPFDIRLQICDEELILNDNGGRSIHFEPLLPGETAFSRSESLWLARGGVARLHESNTLHVLWQALPEDLRLSQHLYLATNSAQGPWWILGWPERIPEAGEPLPAPLPPYRILTGLADCFGRTLAFHRDLDGIFTGNITAVTDGAGRRFRLTLTSQAQRAATAHKQTDSSGVSAPDYPQTMPLSGYGEDNGIRLEAVWLTLDPEYPENLPALPLARYTYTPRGELSAVYDHSGTQVRSFIYDDNHPGRMTAHQHAGRPQITYGYDASGLVVEQHNPAGLSYRYEYKKHAVVITDCLNRREVLHTEGQGGLKRIVREEKADGSMISREFDHAGRMVAMTDAAGRQTEYRLNVGSGNVDTIVSPDGRTTQFYYSNQRQLTSTVWPDGRESEQKYDDAGRLMQEKSRRGDITRYFYDDPHSDMPSAVEDDTGSKKHMTWSRYGQLLTLTDCSGYQTRYEYNRFGQMTAIYQEEGLSQHRVYDERGRLIRRQNAQGHETRYEYSLAGDLTAVIHPDGSRQTTEYDAAGRPVSTTEGGLTRRMEYDTAGRTIRLVNENGASTTFHYDLMDRLTQETGFDGRTQRYHYSINGQLVRSEDERLVTLWHYDESDHLTHRTVNDAEAEQWQYSERGWLTEVSHLSDGHRVAVQYEYDKQGRITLERQTVQHPETGALLWQHVTGHDYSGGGQPGPPPTLSRRWSGSPTAPAILPG
jgi:YD repeat-containing protein